jgi:hypothetical protein
MQKRRNEEAPANTETRKSVNAENAEFAEPRTIRCVGDLGAS